MKKQSEVVRKQKERGYRQIFGALFVIDDWERQGGHCALGFSDADFTALEGSVSTNNAKPTEAEVDSPIDTQNTAHNLQINLDYADRVTT